jgi:hypothetical protein
LLLKVRPILLRWHHAVMGVGDATVSQGMTNMQTHSCIILLVNTLKRQLVGADPAYLSACQTSTSDEKLSQAVHRAGGMLAAGYRGVVGHRSQTRISMLAL